MQIPFPNNIAEQEAVIIFCVIKAQLSDETFFAKVIYMAYFQQFSDSQKVINLRFLVIPEFFNLF
jgi:hypothetical protein